MALLRIGLLFLLLFWQTAACAVNNGETFPPVTLLDRETGESADFHMTRQKDMAIVYVDFFNAGEQVDLEILAKVNGKSIFSDRSDSSKIKVYAIGSITSFLDENRFQVLVDDAFSVPGVLDISLYPYVLTVDCQGKVIGQMYFEPPAAPGDPVQSKGLLEAGKWKFIQESVQRAVSSGACK